MLGCEWFDDGIFSFMPSKEIHIAAAIAAERKGARLLWLVQSELLVADGTCGATNHRESLGQSTVAEPLANASELTGRLQYSVTVTHVHALLGARRF